MLTIQREKVERLKCHISLWKDEYITALALSGNVNDQKAIRAWGMFWKTLIHLQWHYKNHYNRGVMDTNRTLQDCANWHIKHDFERVGFKWESYQCLPAATALPELIEICLQLAYRIEETE